MNGEEFAAALDKIPDEPTQTKLKIKPVVDPIALALAGNIESNFKKILERSAKGDGCEQIFRIVNNQEEQSYDEWCAVLTVANKCEDREVAIHAVSSRYPGYDPTETEKKANSFEGHYDCAAFESRIDPSICARCPHKGKISTPLQLGRVIKREEPPKEPAENKPSPLQSLLPNQYPESYFRGKNGGIYKTIQKKGDEGVEDVLIYKYDLFCRGRTTDPERGDIVEVVLQLPHDGVRTFFIQTSELQSRETARKTLAHYGVSLIPARMEKVVMYIIDWADYLARQKKSEQSHNQMGWTEANSFILGDKEITTSGLKYTPPTVATKRMASAMGIKGSMNEWENVIDQYSKPGMETHAFTVMLGFGAPLFKMFGDLEGVIFNLFSLDSGSGKSTALRAAMSIYGHPKNMMGMWKDTQLALAHNFGVLKNLPACTDEITNWTSAQCSNFAYSVTQGRSNERMKNSANETRQNDTTWQLISMTSSNMSMYNTIGLTKSSLEGEKYRIFEVNVPPLEGVSKIDSDRIFPKLIDNYGHAGIMFLDFVVKHYDEVKARLYKIRENLDRTTNMTPPERYWSGLLAVGLAGGEIAQRDVGLLKSFDLHRIREHVIKLLQDVRQTTAGVSISPVELLGSYFNLLLYDHTLIIDSGYDKRNKINKDAMGQLAGTPAAYKEPRGELVVRVEKDIKRVFVPVKHFREYVTKGRLPYSEILKALMNRKIVLDKTKKRLGKGTFFDTPPVDCLVIDSGHPEFAVDFENIPDAPVENAASVPTE